MELYLGGADRDKLDPILDVCVAVYVNDLDEDGQADFKGKAKAFTRTYDFLAAILPYGVPGWEKLSISLNFLISKLPAPIEDARRSKKTWPKASSTRSAWTIPRQRILPRLAHGHGLWHDLRGVTSGLLVSRILYRMNLCFGWNLSGRFWPRAIAASKRRVLPWSSPGAEEGLLFTGRLEFQPLEVDSVPWSHDGLRIWPHHGCKPAGTSGPSRHICNHATRRRSRNCSSGEELKTFREWWTLLDSNQRPFPCQGNALTN